MANIKTYLNNIKGALYGKDVRGSIHDGMDAINKEVENTTGRQVDLENTFDQLVINAGNSNAEIVDARVKSDGTSYSKLGDRLDAADSQLAHTTYHNACKNGVVLNDINSASSNTRIINELLSKGGCFIEIEGKVYIDDTLLVISKSSLKGVSRGVEIVQVTKNKNIISLNGDNASVSSLTLRLNEIPSQTTACIEIGGSNRECRANNIYDVTIWGKAHVRDEETWEHIITNNDSKCIGIYENIEYSNCAIYFTGIRDVMVYGCEYGISIGHKGNSKGKNSWVTCTSTDNLVCFSCKYFGYFAGGGHSIRGSFQPWFSNMDYACYIESDLSTYDLLYYDLAVGAFNVKTSLYFSNKSLNNEYYVWARNQGGTNYDVTDLGLGNYQRNNYIRSPKRLYHGYSGLDEMTLKNTNVETDYNLEINGTQDNVLAFADKWGKVTSNITPSSGFISDLFGLSKIRELKYSNINTNNPLIITVDLTNNVYIPNMSVLCLQFGEYMAKNIKIQCYYIGSEVITYSNTEEKKGEIIIKKLYHKYVDKIVITVNECWKDDIVTLTGLWATSSSHVGKAYLSKDGGDLYGDLNVNGGIGIVGDVNVSNASNGIKIISNTNYPSLTLQGAPCTSSIFGTVVGETYKGYVMPMNNGGLRVGAGNQYISFYPNLITTNKPFQVPYYNTSERPTNLDRYSRGSMIFDSNLGKVIVWNGSNWVNVDGSSL